MSFGNTTAAETEDKTAYIWRNWELIGSRSRTTQSV
jgi:hypothetical protein